ncbi:MAG TPA: AAA family ATPase [Polyangia bacterium]|nr:AAA family ATPase [Polyangia bacterium]
MKRILAIANQKGGVGKTTTAVNLAASLANQDRRVLVVDLDPQANCTSGLGFAKGTVAEGIYEALSGERPIRELLQLTEVPNLWVVPATRDLSGAEVELVSVERREWRLKDALGPVADQFEYVIIDCPPSLGLLTLNALVAATAVVIPMQCEYYALEGLSQLTATIEQVRAALNPSLELEGILLTMVDPRMNLTQQVADEVRAHFEGKVYRTTIPRNVRLSEAPSHGKPILLYDARSTGCLSYQALATELLHRSRAAA